MLYFNRILICRGYLEKSRTHTLSLCISEKKKRAREETLRGFVWQTYRWTSRPARAVYRGSQVKITRISRCPGSICARRIGKESRRRENIIKSSFDRRGRQGREDRVAARNTLVDTEGILLRESAFKKLPSPGGRQLACIIASNSYVRQRFRVIGHDNAFSVRAAVCHRYSGSLSSSHSCEAPVYGVTSILRDVPWTMYISAERCLVATRVTVMPSFRRISQSTFPLKFARWVRRLDRLLILVSSNIMFKCHIFFLYSSILQRYYFYIHLYTMNWNSPAYLRFVNLSCPRVLYFAHFSEIDILFSQT